MATRDGLPYLIRAEGDSLNFEALERVPLLETPGETQWLQAVLDRAPSLLPLREIDERVEPPLVSLGREIPTPAGPIDNLFLSANGYLVVVETKLWRNPDARRQVIAQLLDYAAHVRKWRYSDLEMLVSRKPGSQHTTLWDLVRPVQLEEQDWVDQVNDNLCRGLQ